RGQHQGREERSESGHVTETLLRRRSDGPRHDAGVEAAHYTRAVVIAALALGLCAALVLAPGRRPAADEEAERAPLAARLLFGTVSLAIGAAWLALTLLAYHGGSEGVNVAESGWRGDPGAWQRTALVLAGAVAVVGLGATVRAMLSEPRRLRTPGAV